MTDNDTITKAQRQMNKAALEIAKMANDVADAKTCKEFNSDRLKRALSVEVAKRLEESKAVSAAEHWARASNSYGTALHDLSEQYKAALRVIEQHDALKVTFESARSIVSMEKAKIGMM